MNNPTIAVNKLLRFLMGIAQFIKTVSLNPIKYQSIPSVKAFDRHISFVLSFTGVYISAEKFTDGCFPLDALRLPGL